MCLLLITLSCLFLSTLNLAAQDWPQWRGPNDNWHSDDPHWSPEALSDGARVLWRAQVGTGHAAASITGHRLYTLGLDDARSDDSTAVERLSCLNRHTGQVIWTKDFISRQFQYYGPGSTPTLEGGRLYMLQRDGTVRALNPENGTQYWQRRLHAERLTMFNPWGICSSILIVNHQLFINAGRAGLCLDKQSGQTLWHNGNGEPGHATPVRFLSHGRPLIAIQTYDSLYALDQSTGARQWALAWQSDADPVFYGERAYINGCKYRGQGTRVIDFSQGSPKTVWASDRSQYAFTPIIIHNGYAYTRTQKKSGQFILNCVDIETGMQTWQQLIGHWGSLMLAGDKLIAINGEGQIKLIKADPAGYQLLGEASIYDKNDLSAFRLGQQKRRTCWTPPVLTGGRLYVRDTWGELVCIDMSNERRRKKQ